MGYACKLSWAKIWVTVWRLMEVEEILRQSGQSYSIKSVFLHWPSSQYLNIMNWIIDPFWERPNLFLYPSLQKVLTVSYLNVFLYSPLKKTKQMIVLSIFYVLVLLYHPPVSITPSFVGSFTTISSKHHSLFHLSVEPQFLLFTTWDTSYLEAYSFLLLF